MSKKFFPEERNKLEEIDENSQVLIKTIRLSKNLFSLTERLPKNKYSTRNRSNELKRDVSQDSVLVQNSLSIITPQAQAANSFKLKADRDASPTKVSRGSDEGTDQVNLN